MTTVVDASVVIKWFVREELRTEALGLLRDEDRLAAPDLLVPEATNIAWKKARRREIDEAQARIIVSGLENSGIELIPSLPLRDRALEIGLALDHPVYDCFYIATAERLDSPFVTADRRLCAAVERTALEGVVRFLSA